MYRYLQYITQKSKLIHNKLESYIYSNSALTLDGQPSPELVYEVAYDPDAVGCQPENEAADEQNADNQKRNMKNESFWVVIFMNFFIFFPN